jgi:hypothetical protein
MTASNAEIRDWIRSNIDPDLSDRGKIPAGAKAAYYEANPEQATEDVLEQVADEVIAEDDEQPGTPDETRPVKPTRKAAAARQRSGYTRADRFVGRLMGEGKPRAKSSRAKKAIPRVGLEKFVSRWYVMLGRVVTPVSPATARCMQVQAPMAGVLLEDVARGTVVDKFLQPVARAEDKLDKIFALAAPPVCVFGLEMIQAQAAMEYAEHGSVSPSLQMRQSVLMSSLRESLRIGMDISESYADQIRASIQRNERYEAEIDKLIQLIFPPQPGLSVVQDEDDNEPEMAGV